MSETVDFLDLIGDDLRDEIENTPDNSMDPQMDLPPTESDLAPPPPKFNPADFSDQPVANRQQQRMPPPQQPGATPNYDKPAYADNGEGVLDLGGDNGLPPAGYDDHGYYDPNMGAMDGEKKERRKQISSKWIIRIYNRLQELGSTVLYDKVNQPQAVLARKHEMEQKIMTGKSLDEEEQIEYKALKDIGDGFLNRRIKFHETCGMEDDLVTDATEMLQEIMEVEGHEPNPVMVLLILLGVTPAMNLMNTLIEYQQYKKSF